MSKETFYANISILRFFSLPRELLDLERDAAEKNKLWI